MGRYMVVFVGLFVFIGLASSIEITPPPLPPIEIPPYLEPLPRIQLGAIEDTYIEEGLPYSNFGTDFYLRTGHVSAEFGGDIYSLVKFDLSGIPQNTTIYRAYLCLYLKDEEPENNAGYYEYKVATATDTWHEDSATWNRFNSAIGEELDSLKFDHGVDRYYCWNVTKAVSYWVSTPYINCPTPSCFRIPTNKGFVVYTENVHTTIIAKFESRENAHVPKLVIYYKSEEPLNVTEAEEAVEDSEPPTIYIRTVGGDGKTYRDIEVMASDDNAVKGIEIYDGAQRLHYATDIDVNPYTYTFRISKPGDHEIRVFAYDYGGNVANKTVSYHVGTNTPPDIKLELSTLNPAVGETFIISVEADSSPEKIIHLVVSIKPTPGNIRILDDLRPHSTPVRSTYSLTAERTVRSYTVKVEAYDEEGLSAVKSVTALVGRCNDGIQNQDETGVDCGGSCEDCNNFEYGLIVVGHYSETCKQDDIDDWHEKAEGFGDNLPHYWRRIFYYQDDDAYEKMFRDVSNGGEDSLYVDNVDLVFYSGHGGMFGRDQYWYYLGAFSNPKDGCFMNSREMKFGEDLDWLILDSCHSLENSGGNKQWWYAWRDVFQGLHMIMGFNGVSWTGWTTIEIGEDFADNLKDGNTFTQAWLDAATDWACCNKPAVMAVNVDVLNNDHLPGRGTVVYVPKEQADPNAMIWFGYTDCWGLDWC